MPISERDLEDIRKDSPYKKSLFHLGDRLTSQGALITKDVIDLAEALKTNTHLEEIFITEAALDAHSFGILADVLKDHPSIKKISLRSNFLTDDGAQVVAELLHANPRITEINVSSNHIEAKGALIISEAIKDHPNLAKINLSHNYIGDEGLNAISSVIPSCSRNLTEIIIPEHKYKNDSLKTFTEALKANIEITNVGEVERDPSVKKLINRNRRYVDLTDQVKQGNLSAFKAIGNEYKDFADRAREVTMPSLLQQNIYLLKQSLLTNDKSYYRKIENLQKLLNVPHDLFDQLSPAEQFPKEFQFIHLLRQLENPTSYDDKQKNLKNLNLLFLELPNKTFFMDFLAQTPELMKAHNYLNSTPAIAARTENYLSQAKDKFGTWVTQLKNNWELRDVGFFSKVHHKRADVQPIEETIKNMQAQNNLLPIQQLFSDTMTEKTRSTARNATAHNHSIISYFLNELKNDTSAQKALGLTLENVDYLLPTQEAARKQALAAIQKAKLSVDDIPKPAPKI